MSQPACTSTTKRGTACRSFALPGRDVCIMHAPDLAVKVRAAQRRGGTAAAKLRVLQGRRLRLDTPGALVRFSSNLVQDTLAGTVEVDLARTVFYGLSVQLKALELAEQSETRRLLSEVERLTHQVRRGA